MKKIFTLCSALLFSAFGFAQTASELAGNYTGTLNVQLVQPNGTVQGKFDPAVITIPITAQGDSLINFSLKNLILKADNSVMYVGSVDLNNLTPANPLVADKKVRLRNGDNPKDAAWIGAVINNALGGSVPVALTATFDDQYVTMDIGINISRALGYNVSCKFKAPRYAVQMKNPDFEESWTTRTYSSGKTEQTPAGWHSFYDAQGGLKSFAALSGSLKQVEGYDGTGYAAQITPNVIFGTTANGNLTNGYVNMGAMKADDSNNHNYTDIADTAASLRFSLLPDSIAAYYNFVSGKTSEGNASVTAILHGAYNYTDPEAAMSADDIAKYKVARAHGSIAPTSGWKRLAFPFDYNGDVYQTSTQNYMLVSFSTNETPGKGNANDALSIDHVRFIYNSGLSSLNVNGEELTVDNSSDTAKYRVESGYFADRVIYAANGKGASVDTTFNGKDNALYITVSGADALQNPTNKHVYVVAYGSPVGIKTAKADADKAALVSVYTVDGVLLRKDVKPATATEGLPAGIYVVGKEKVLVK